jgi:hypothetical protein
MSTLSFMPSGLSLFAVAEDTAGPVFVRAAQQSQEQVPTAAQQVAAADALQRHKEQVPHDFHAGTTDVDTMMGSEGPHFKPSSSGDASFVKRARFQKLAPVSIMLKSCSEEAEELER